MSAGLHVCAACDEMVTGAHPAEWQCQNRACGVWFHGSSTLTDRTVPVCDDCGTEYSDRQQS